MAIEANLLVTMLPDEFGFYYNTNPDQLQITSMHLYRNDLYIRVCVEILKMAGTISVLTGCMFVKAKVDEVLHAIDS